MNPSAPARSGRGRRGITLTVLAGFLAPSAVLAAAAPVQAGPDNGGSPSGATATAASSRTATRAAATDGTDAAGYIFGYSFSCTPVLNVSTTEGQTTLPAIDTGWYGSDGTHGSGNTNYVAGQNYFRNFFVFDTAGIVGTVTSARLDVTQAGGCSSGEGEPSTYWLNDVSTPVATLVASNTGDDAGKAVYSDLRVGESYGRTKVADPNADVSVDFSPAGVAALAVTDGLFAVGGAYYDIMPTTTLVADPAEGDGVGRDQVKLTATVTGVAGEGAPAGTVDFTQDGSAVADCTDVVLAPGEGEEATATCEVPSLRPGVYDYAATYSGDERYGVGQPGRTSYDGRLTPAVDVTVEDETEGTYRTEEVTLTTAVTGVEGESAPGGVVGFDVDGEPVSDCQNVALVEVVGTNRSQASCDTAFQSTGEHTISSSYDGDGTYRAGVGVPMVVDVLDDAPTITAAVTSVDEPSATGWFQAPAMVTFTCESFHGLEGSGCPEPVTVGSNGRRELERTVTDVEGQQASSTVVVKVDKRAPRVVVRHVRDGATYDRMRQPRCTAFDRHSRVAGDCEAESEVVRTFRDGRRKVAFTATAMDRADNVKQKSGSFFVR